MPSFPKIGVLIACPLLALLASCGRDDKAATPPPTPVEVVTVVRQPIPNVTELPGRIEAVRTAEVRARTDGIVQQRLYEEGSDVRAGTPLFAIDQRDYRAQVAAAQATLQRTVAARDNAKSIVTRYEPLIKERAVSAQEYDAARSDYRQAEAQVGEAQAALARARLLLSYTIIRAPISGRVGRAEVTEGALVSGAQGTLMTRIDQVSPVYAVFAESSATILNTMQEVQRGDLKLDSISRVEVRLVLENGTLYGPVGHLDFASTSVDPETGSQNVRAQFPNTDNLLKPGQFVHGRITAGMIADGILVPARAIQFKGEEASVSILGRDDAVISRPVTLGALLGKNWIVRSGIKPGERVIVEGWQKVRPGQKAQPRPIAGQKAPARQER